MLSIRNFDIAKEQDKDQHIIELKNALKFPTKATTTLHRKAKSYLLDNNILFRKNMAHSGQARLIVLPTHLIPEVLNGCHDNPMGGGHFGYARTLSKIRQNYFWENMYKEIETYVQTCADCQSFKRPIRPPQGKMTSHFIPSEPFTKLGMDLLGPFKRSNDFTMIIAVIDYTSKFLIAKSIKSGSAPDVAHFLIEDVFTKFGLVSEIVCDRGSSFRSQLITELLRLMNIKPTFTTSYSPFQNGQIERANSIIIQQLAMYVSTDQKNWSDFVAMAAFSYNCCQQESTQNTPFKLLFCRSPRLPHDITILPPSDNVEAWKIAERFDNTQRDVVQKIKHAQNIQKQTYDAGRVIPSYAPKDLVLIYSPIRHIGKSPKLTHHWFGPFEIISKVSDSIYKVKIKYKNKLIEDDIHVTRIKKYYAPPS